MLHMVDTRVDTPLGVEKEERIKYIITQVKRLLGFFLLVFLLYTHIYSKPIDVRLLAIPGIVMGIDIKSFLDFRNPRNG